MFLTSVATLLLAAVGVLALGSGAGAESNDTNQTSGTACALSFSQALALAHKTWDDLLLILGDRVELLAFEDTVMQQFQHASLRRTLRPLHLVEGTEVSGLRAGDLTLIDVNDTEPAVYFNVKLKPLKIRGALRTGDNTHLLRAFLVDMTFRFRTVVDGRALLNSNSTVRHVAATRYGLARAGHVANGDRTETAFGQEVEALLAGAAVTTVWHELQRAASVHINWQRERPRPLQWEPTQNFNEFLLYLFPNFPKLRVSVAFGEAFALAPFLCFTIQLSEPLAKAAGLGLDSATGQLVTLRMVRRTMVKGK
ncbi:hypothetical protein KUF71_016633, partial [Frankliniella fusca]